MEPIEIIRIINFTLAALFVICYAYQFVYLISSSILPFPSSKRTSPTVPPYSTATRF